ncbi:MAG: hypothetical protein R2747_23275 [Pyrinomonadaceae bacterium]
MTLTPLLFDIPPYAGGAGIFIGVVFFLFFAALAFIVFKLLKRTVKMAVRMIIVAVILLIAFVGGTAFLMLGLF